MAGNVYFSRHLCSCGQYYIRDIIMRRVLFAPLLERIESNIIYRVLSTRKRLFAPSAPLAQHKGNTGPTYQQMRDVDQIVVLMFAHRLRRWPNIKTTLGQRLLSAGICVLWAVTRTYNGVRPSVR